MRNVLGKQLNLSLITITKFLGLFFPYSLLTSFLSGFLNATHVQWCLDVKGGHTCLMESSIWVHVWTKALMRYGADGGVSNRLLMIKCCLNHADISHYFADD